MGCTSYIAPELDLTSYTREMGITLTPPQRTLLKLLAGETLSRELEPDFYRETPDGPLIPSSEWDFWVGPCKGVFPNIMRLGRRSGKTFMLSILADFLRLRPQGKVVHLHSGILFGPSLWWAKGPPKLPSRIEPNEVWLLDEIKAADLPKELLAQSAVMTDCQDASFPESEVVTLSTWVLRPDVKFDPAVVLHPKYGIEFGA